MATIGKEKLVVKLVEKEINSDTIVEISKNN